MLIGKKLMIFCWQIVDYWWRCEFEFGSDDGKMNMDKQWVEIIRFMFKGIDGELAEQIDKQNKFDSEFVYY